MPKLMFSFSLGIVILCLPTSQILTQSYAIKKKIYIYICFINTFKKHSVSVPLLSLSEVIDLVVFHRVNYAFGVC
jgi:hypothetical protein